MKKFKEASAINLYPERPNLKWVVLVVSFLIGAGSIIYTNQLVKKIRQRERKQIDLYARTLEYLANESNTGNLQFIFEEIIQANQTIPVILTDQYQNPEHYRNLPDADLIKSDEERRVFLARQLKDMESEREPIVVTLKDEEGKVFGYKYIYYRNSTLLVQLKYYPYVQLSIIAVFVVVAFIAFNYSRVVEQNKVWVGLAKETAHQLGTPLSSLMAWVEYFKTEYPDQSEIVQELNKDVERLQMITERFSNIGSVPQLTKEDLPGLVREVVEYLRKRLSTKVSIDIEVFPDGNMAVDVNRPLFAWVIENLIKNAVDAMEGKGAIHIRIIRIIENRVAVDISDTGKGIPKNRVSQVFKPGYSTKRRGWGLGLTLTKRIVENYHQGKILVKHTEVNKGTTFRIVLKA